MQTTKKSKIFLALLFLVALLFLSCSFEDTLGAEVQGSQVGNNRKKTNLPRLDIGSDGSYIPKIYMGRYTEFTSNTIKGYMTVSNDNKGDYIIHDGGNKEYIKDLVYAGENTWEQVISNDGYYLTTWQYTIKFEKNIRIFLFTFIKTHIDRGHSFTNYQYRYIHDEDMNR